jgi:uncharacterized membrane protein YphA (DoxX/SURF4 family)
MASGSTFWKVARLAGVWLVTLFIVFVFATQGFAKFSSQGFWAGAFARWGYPVWFRLLIGVVEILAALLLLVPRLAAYGAMLVVTIMVGGIATKLHAGQARAIVVELVWILLATLVFLARRRQARRLAGDSPSAAPQ